MNAFQVKKKTHEEEDNEELRVRQEKNDDLHGLFPCSIAIFSMLHGLFFHAAGKFCKNQPCCMEVL